MSADNPRRFLLLTEDVAFDAHDFYELGATTPEGAIEEARAMLQIDGRLIRGADGEVERARVVLVIDDLPVADWIRSR